MPVGLSQITSETENGSCEFLEVKIALKVEFDEPPGFEPVGWCGGVRKSAQVSVIILDVKFVEDRIRRTPTRIRRNADANCSRDSVISESVPRAATLFELGLRSAPWVVTKEAISLTLSW